MGQNGPKVSAHIDFHINFAAFFTSKVIRQNSNRNLILGKLIIYDETGR